MLMKLHLIECVSDHRVVVINQSQARDVDEIVPEIF